MNATPPTFIAPGLPVGAALPGLGPSVGPGSEPAGPGRNSSGAMEIKWVALGDAARVVATLAGLPQQPVQPAMPNFLAVMDNVGGWRRNMAVQGIADLSAIMEAGLAALLAVHTRGANPAPAAVALSQEFEIACAALLALRPPSSD